jgi:hypothetical protein
MICPRCRVNEILPPFEECEVCREADIRSVMPSAPGYCEVCGDETKATLLVDRTWGMGPDRGAVDKDLPVCAKHSRSDPDGWWQMSNIRQLCA